MSKPAAKAAGPKPPAPAKKSSGKGETDKTAFGLTPTEELEKVEEVLEGCTCANCGSIILKGV
jgi:hypothetical protein